ncbi:hypothetical protein FGO68_gene3572 [Halteria grandinella]|uniref:Uncharacterized protein n=1 Tax=Halteria grandinella TaxID=5974 RepID=A0A8J8P615_HALGN|nr:hypothetical protein FGO68_gene3572 [Halteria grandinella]
MFYFSILSAAARDTAYSMRGFSVLMIAARLGSSLKRLLFALSNSFAVFKSWMNSSSRESLDLREYIKISSAATSVLLFSGICLKIYC